MVVVVGLTVLCCCSSSGTFRRLDAGFRLFESVLLACFLGLLFAVRTRFLGSRFRPVLGSRMGCDVDLSRVRSLRSSRVLCSCRFRSTPFLFEIVNNFNLDVLRFHDLIFNKFQL